MFRVFRYLGVWVFRCLGGVGTKKNATGQNKQPVVGTKKSIRDKKTQMGQKRHLGQNKKWQTGQKTCKMDNYVRKEGAREGGEKAGGGAQI